MRKLIQNKYKELKNYTAVSRWLKELTGQDYSDVTIREWCKDMPNKPLDRGEIQIPNT